MIYYPNPVNAGTDKVNSLGDGYSLCVSWFQAEHSILTNKIAYHIYYSTIKENVFSDGIKYASIDSSLQANLIDLIPGQEYFVAVRPVEYDPTQFNLNANLPIAYNNLRIYPSSILSQDISATDLIIPLMDVSSFPFTGIIQIGAELIQYLAIDQVNNNLIVPAASAGAPVTIISQSGHFYVPKSSNHGSGTINALMTIPGSTGPSESWNILCIFVEKDSFNNPIPGTAKFEAIGSISGSKIDGYGNNFVWLVNGPIISNGILSFSITENTTFNLGDSFNIQVSGNTANIPSGRGYNNTIANSHTVGGFDGYNYYSPNVNLYTIGESSNWDRIFACQCRFEYPNYAFTLADGYKQVATDLLSTDLADADAANVTFPMYDFAGWHRTDPVQLLNGTCVGSYIGGEMGCIDAYGNYNIMRGLSLQDQNTQRQDVLLSVTGRPAVLIRRVQTGITCACYLASSEYQDDRCPLCYGTKFVFGYQQYFNPRISSGRIQVRTGPTAENLKMQEAGLESTYPLDMWTLTVPTIKTRDVIVLFDQDDNEEFRYEVADVTRNQTILGLVGDQHFTTYRVRKFDPIYQIRIFRNTADFPQTYQTSTTYSTGLGYHSHSIQISETITSMTQINQTTGISAGHNHPIINGIVQNVLGHTHDIVMY